jgi:multidrug efflux pump subunit AcrA (membrane-fusion protein)
LLNVKKGASAMLFRNRWIFALALAVTVTSCGRHAQKKNTAGGEMAIAVRLQHPARIARPLSVAASGTVEALDTVDLGFQVAGRVARVLVEEGQHVRKGETLAELEATDYQFGLQASEGQVGMAQSTFDKAQAGSRREELDQARAAFEKAADDYRRYRQLYERKSMAPVDFAKVEAGYRVAKAQYEMAQNGARIEDRAAAGFVVKQAQAQAGLSRKRVSDSRLISPIEGMVARRSIDPGEMAGVGTPVFSIVNLNPARIRVGIPEAEIGKIHAGQSATISIPALDKTEFQGKVDLVGVAADPNSRTFTVKIAVPNPKLLLKAGMIAEASIEASGTIDVITIPGEAIVHDPQGSMLVYVYFPDGKRVHARRVETGTVRNRDIEILAGLSSEDLIVIAGQHNVREGSRVEVTP